MIIFLTTRSLHIYHIVRKIILPSCVFDPRIKTDTITNMSLPFDMEPPLRPHTRLPAINRSPSPNFLDSMKDLVPAPLRKSRSPLLRSRASDEGNRTQPIDMVGARAGWDCYPSGRIQDSRQARSVSPQPTYRALTPAPVREPRPQQKYLHVPPEYLAAEQVRNPPVSTNRRPYLPSSKTSSLRNNLREPLRSPSGARIQIKPGVRAPGVPGTGQSRRYVPSMVDYLSLEQLENLWQSQDLYKGPIDVPQKPASPLWRLSEDDPRSPIHPAFRPNFSTQNSFASAVI